MNGIFVTGTGTDVGKTYVTGLIVKKLREAGLNAGYYKMAISGAEKDSEGNLLAGDALFVNEMAKLHEEQKNLVSFVYEEAVSPHLAARRAKQEIDFDVVQKDFERAKQKYEYLTVEGSGGIVCPLRWDENHVLLDDMVSKLNLGVFVVSQSGLGSINDAVLTIFYLKAKKIPIRGIFLNHFVKDHFMYEDNAKMIEEITGVKILAKISDGDTDLDIDPKFLASFYK